MKKNDLILILVPTFIFVVVWIASNIYHSSVTSTITSNETVQILYIDPNFDSKTINELKKRERLVPFYASSSAITNAVLPSPTPIAIEPTPSGSQSAQTASSGGSLNQ